MMKKFILSAILFSNILIACSNTSSQEGEHKHDDGSTHTDHTDTIAPAQQEEFIADSTVTDTIVKEGHDESKPHSH
jgi:hypothetical protein